MAEDANIWGLPDWRQFEAYPKTESTMRIWWWEFIRRRPQYRTLWQTAIAKREISESDTVISDDFEWLRFNYQMTTILDPCKQFTDFDLMCHRFPSNYLQSRPQTYEWRGFDDDQLDSIQKASEYKARLETEHSIVRYTFDLTKPIEPQLAKAKIMLQSHQGNDIKIPKHRTYNWPNFLRVLDAREIGVTYQTISDVLWPGLEKPAQSARDVYNAAVKLRDNITI